MKSMVDSKTEEKMINIIINSGKISSRNNARKLLHDYNYDLKKISESYGINFKNVSGSIQTSDYNFASGNSLSNTSKYNNVIGSQLAGGFEVVEVIHEEVTDENPETWYLNGEEQLSLRHYDEAIESFEQAIEYADGNNSVTTKCNVKIVYTYYASGKINKAREKEEAMNKVNSNLYDQYYWNNTDILLEFWKFDKPYWNDYWIACVNNKLKNRDMHFLNKYDKYIEGCYFKGKYDDKDIAWLIREDNLDLLRKLINSGEKVLSMQYTIEDDKRCNEISYIDISVKPDKVNALMYAVFYNAAQTRDYCLNNGINNINDTNINGFTALHFSLLVAPTSVTKLLIDKGSNVNAVTSKGVHPLDICVCKDSMPATMKLLIAAGANVNYLYNGQSPLWYACLRGKSGYVKILLDNGANPNFKSTIEDRSVLFAAISACSAECMKLLLEKGADAEFKTFSQETALMYCTVRGFADGVNVLKGYANPNVQWSNGDTPLIYVAKNNHWDHKGVYNALLSYKNIDVNVQDNKGWTALMHSLDYNWTFTDEYDMARALIRCGANKKIKAHDGTTAKGIVRRHGLGGIASEFGVDRSTLSKTSGSVFNMIGNFFS